MEESSVPRHVFQEGDSALMIDRKGRRYLIRLRPSEAFHSHIGHVSHDDLIGHEEGTWLTTSKGHYLLAMKPTMADFTLDMPRIATVIYPKDQGAILTYGDIFPGAKVLEAGSGSGALTMTLLRAVGEHGSLVSYDLREDMLKRAETNVSAMFPTHPNLTFKQGDVNDGFEEDNLDRIVLDLPEPWHVIPHADEKMVPGGIFLSFLPTVLQVHDLTVALKEQRTFEMIETFEIMMRPWSVSGRAVRPAHRMVAHTGFITTARKCSPRPSSQAATKQSKETEAQL